MRSSRRKLLHNCLRELLRPVVGFCVRHSLSIQEFTELSKAAFVDAGAKELERRGEVVNVSKVSVLTGLRRRETDRLFKEDPSVEVDQASIHTRVINRWRQDQRFLTSSGRPRVLSYLGEGSEFFTLVASVSTDIKPGTVFAELLRVGAVEEAPRGLRLLHQAYAPKGKPLEGFKMLAEDADDLTCAVEENMFELPSIPNLHIATSYDRINANKLEKVRRWLLNEGVRFHKKVQKYLSALDIDVNPDNTATQSARVVVGSFSRIVSDENHDEETK